MYHNKMNFLRWTCIYFTLSVLIPDGKTIYEGEIAEERQFKYVVLVIVYGYQYCGGAIIDENHILSAAHCYEGAVETDLTIAAGTNERRIRGAGAIREVRKITRHEKYKPADLNPSFCKVCLQRMFSCILEHPHLNAVPTNDIAILTLKNPLPFSGYIDKIPYKPTNNQLSDCNQCQLAGFGKITPTVSSYVLRWAIYDILSPQKCKEFDARHRKNEFCAMDVRERSCNMKGDSGSPLVCNGVMIGILSTSVPNPRYPSTYANVSEHIDFIERVLKEDEN